MYNEILTQISDTRGKTMKRHIGVDFDTGYNYVYVVSYDGEMTYRTEFKGFYQCFAKSKDAAKALDLHLLQSKRKQVNNMWKEK
jgi:hypothetical protein